MQSTQDAEARFRPFEQSPWKGGQKELVGLLWAWREQLKKPGPVIQGVTPQVFFKEQAENIRARQPLSFGDQILSRKLFEACEAQTLPVEWLAQQVEAAHHFTGPIRFDEIAELKKFISNWIAPHGYLLAKLAGAAHRWQLKQVEELATAFFLIDHIINLPADLEKDRLFMPLSELDVAGVRVMDLKEGMVTDATRKLLWKQVIRVRDAFAQGQPLVNELPKSFRRPFKYYWLMGLELANQVEKRKYDVWSKPIILTGLQQFQVRVLSFISKGAGKAR